MLNEDSIKDLIGEFRDIWFEMSSNYYVAGKAYSVVEKTKNEKEINDFFEVVNYRFLNIPKEKEKLNLWFRAFKEEIKRFICSISFLDERDKAILCKDEIFKNTLEFLKEAINFDSEMELVDIGQALRNVWIMNIMQFVLGIDIKMTKAIFAYSMLYPYTDNLLDDKKISKEDKYGFNERLEKIIDGEHIQAYNNYEEKVWRLINYIEGEFPRQENEDVYKALLYIKKAQDKSLYQQIPSLPYEKDILGISIEKGGTSVLADGYLIKGKLSSDELWFFFGYGFMLQICDDIQDGKNDKESEHMTIVSQTIKNHKLDVIASKLMDFINYLLDNNKCFTEESGNDIKELIRKNCLMMVYFAIIKDKNCYSKGFVRELMPYLPYRVKYMRSFENKMKKKYNKLCKKLDKQNIDLKQIINSIEI